MYAITGIENAGNLLCDNPETLEAVLVRHLGEDFTVTWGNPDETGEVLVDGKEVAKVIALRPVTMRRWIVTLNVSEGRVEQCKFKAITSLEVIDRVQKDYGRTLKYNLGAGYVVFHDPDDRFFFGTITMVAD